MSSTIAPVATKLVFNAKPEAVKSGAEPAGPVAPAVPLGPRARYLASIKWPLVTPVVNVKVVVETV